ncbi:MAG: DNA polymerase III subunit delta [Proteobacteria bacterium]|nr:DNA polymerase III subunit delta [Pseudomonadota bacterium]
MQFEDESAFVRQLARTPLPPAILIAGVDDLRVIEAADAVRAKARADGCERTIYDVDGRFDWDVLVGDFSALSLFASARLLDVRVPDGKVGKEGSEVIAGFCKDPPPGTTLLVTCMEWSKRHAESAWVKAIGKAGQVLAMWALPRHKLPDWLLRRMSARGIDASHEAAELLAARVEGNLLAAAQEVDKLCLLLAQERAFSRALREHGDGEAAARVPGERERSPAGTSMSRSPSSGSRVRIDAPEMQRLVADSARFDVFKLADACVAGEPARALRIVRTLRAEGEAVPAVLGGLIPSLLQLAGLAAQAARGDDLRAAMNAQRIWDARQAQFRRALERHDAARWEAFAIEAGRIDRMSKGRADGDPWVAMERLLAAVASARGRALVA